MSPSQNKLDSRTLATASKRDEYRSSLKNLRDIKEDFGIENNFSGFEPNIENTNQQVHSSIDYFHKCYGADIFIKLGRNSDIYYLQMTNTMLNTKKNYITLISELH